jgi:anaerobic magnesium-protoporphyrin IX monomethyl ester cyclase
MTDVLLINPITSLFEFTPVAERRHFVLSPPLGLLYLASVLEGEGYSCKVIDMESSLHSKEMLTKVLEKEEAPIMGVSISTPAFGSALEAARTVKQCLPETIVICGGAHTTLRYEEVLAHDEFDIAVRGEGENTIVDLANHILRGESHLKNIPGIAYWSENGLQTTSDRPFIEDLDVLPFPARHLIDINQFVYGGSLISGRGCQHKCIFCAAGPLSGYRYRVRSPENVVEEMEEIHRAYGITDFVFVDDCLTAFPERTRILCELIKDLDFSPTWTCESRVNTVTPSLLKVMADSGCIRIQFGCESGSDTVLKSIKKGTTVRQIENAVFWATRNDIKSVCSFIIGHPEDTEQTVRKTISLSKKLLHIGGEENVVLQFMLAIPLPGTELYERMNELGVNMVLKNQNIYDYGDPLIETGHLTREQLRSLLFDAYVDTMVVSGEGVAF